MKKKLNKNFDKENLINYRIESSNNDYKTMLDLFKTKNYNWTLFMGHLVIEKLLKALYIKKLNEHPPLIHDLRRISEKAGIISDSDQIIILDTITRFNINARYDDYKQNFYKLCTFDFAAKWIKNIKETRKWIKKELSN
jgi:HEPN domain-containing protein